MTKSSRDLLQVQIEYSTMSEEPVFQSTPIIAYPSSCLATKRLREERFCKISKRLTELWHPTFWKTRTLSRNTKTEYQGMFFRRKSRKILPPKLWLSLWNRCILQETSRVHWPNSANLKISKTAAWLKVSSLKVRRCLREIPRCLYQWKRWIWTQLCIILRNLIVKHCKMLPLSMEQTRAHWSSTQSPLRLTLTPSSRLTTAWTLLSASPLNNSVPTKKNSVNLALVNHWCPIKFLASTPKDRVNTTDRAPSSKIAFCHNLTTYKNKQFE